MSLFGGIPVEALNLRKKVVGLSTSSVSKISTAMMARRFRRDIVTNALSSWNSFVPLYTYPPDVPLLVSLSAGISGRAMRSSLKDSLTDFCAGWAGVEAVLAPETPGTLAAAAAAGGSGVGKVIGVRVFLIVPVFDCWPATAESAAGGGTGAGMVGMVGG